MLFMLAGIARARKSASGDWSGIGRIADVGGRAWSFRLFDGKSAGGTGLRSVKVIRCLASRHGPIRCGSPFISGSALFSVADRAHHVVTDDGIPVHAGIDAFQ